MKSFDQKFGRAFISSLPTSPAVYRVYSEAGVLIYVGKAKNLRRRLSQYRNAKRRKRHHKMRSVVAEGARIEFDLYASDREASLAEAILIQDLRPKLNVAGAFYFLYPMIGIAMTNGDLELIYTTEPEKIDSKRAKAFSFHGAYRSRFFCGKAFFALVELLEYLGHKNKTKKLSKYTYLYSFRQLDESWHQELELLFSGESSAFFERLVLGLVENKSARKNTRDVQKQLNQIKTFWKHEAQLLRRVRLKVGFSAYPVPQKQRDLLFLEHRFHETNPKDTPQPIPQR
jgi:hypothetical protein